MLVAAAVTLVSAGAVTAGGSKVIGHGQRLKGTRIFYARGTALAPRRISASIVPVPTQGVKVQWSLVCQKPNTSDPAIHVGIGSTSGQTSLRGSATVKLRLPYAKPPSCVATVYATLAGGGNLVLRLLQT